MHDDQCQYQYPSFQQPLLPVCICQGISQAKKNWSCFCCWTERAQLIFLPTIDSAQLLGYVRMCKNNFFSCFHKCGAVWKTSVNEEKTFWESFHCGDVQCTLCIAHHRPFFNFTNRNLIQFHFLLSSSIMFQQRPAFHLISNFSFERHRFIPKAYIQRPVKRKAWTCVPIFSCPGSSLPVPLVPESNFKFNFGPIAWVSILSGDILSSVILSRLTCSEFGPMSSTHMNILVENKNRKELYRTTFLQAA